VATSLRIYASIKSNQKWAAMDPLRKTLAEAGDEGAQGLADAYADGFVAAGNCPRRALAGALHEDRCDESASRFAVGLLRHCEPDSASAEAMLTQICLRSLEIAPELPGAERFVHCAVTRLLDASHPRVSDAWESLVKHEIASVIATSPHSTAGKSACLAAAELVPALSECENVITQSACKALESEGSQAAALLPRPLVARLLPALLKYQKTAFSQLMQTLEHLPAITAVGVLCAVSSSLPDSASCELARSIQNREWLHNSCVAAICDDTHSLPRRCAANILQRIVGRSEGPGWHLCLSLLSIETQRDTCDISSAIRSPEVPPEIVAASLTRGMKNTNPSFRRSFVVKLIRLQCLQDEPIDRVASILCPWFVCDHLLKALGNLPWHPGRSQWSCAAATLSPPLARLCMHSGVAKLADLIDGTFHQPLGLIGKHARLTMASVVELVGTSAHDVRQFDCARLIASVDKTLQSSHSNLDTIALRRTIDVKLCRGTLTCLRKYSSDRQQYDHGFERSCVYVLMKCDAHDIWALRLQSGDLRTSVIPALFEEATEESAQCIARVVALAPEHTEDIDMMLSQLEENLDDRYSRQYRQNDHRVKLGCTLLKSLLSDAKIHCSSAGWSAAFQALAIALPKLSTHAQQQLGRVIGGDGNAELAEAVSTCIEEVSHFCSLESSSVPHEQQNQVKQLQQTLRELLERTACVNVSGSAQLRVIGGVSRNLQLLAGNTSQNILEGLVETCLKGTESEETRPAAWYCISRLLILLSDYSMSTAVRDAAFKYLEHEFSFDTLGRYAAPLLRSALMVVRFSSDLSASLLCYKIVRPAFKLISGRRRKRLPSLAAAVSLTFNSSLFSRAFKSDECLEELVSFMSEAISSCGNSLRLTNLAIPAFLDCLLSDNLRGLVHHFTTCLSSAVCQNVHFTVDVDMQYELEDDLTREDYRSLSPGSLLCFEDWEQTKLHLPAAILCFADRLVERTECNDALNLFQELLSVAQAENWSFNYKADSAEHRRKRRLWQLLACVSRSTAQDERTALACAPIIEELLKGHETFDVRSLMELTLLSCIGALSPQNAKSLHVRICDVASDDNQSSGTLASYLMLAAQIPLCVLHQSESALQRALRTELGWVCAPLKMLSTLSQWLVLELSNDSRYECCNQNMDSLLLAIRHHNIGRGNMKRRDFTRKHPHKQCHAKELLNGMQAELREEKESARDMELPHEDREQNNDRDDNFAMLAQSKGESNEEEEGLQLCSSEFGFTRNDQEASSGLVVVATLPSKNENLGGIARTLDCLAPFASLLVPERGVTQSRAFRALSMSASDTSTSKSYPSRTPQSTSTDCGDQRATRAS